ncbi:protein ILITYHIA isoform X2 [Tanacetum coccineum]
MKSNGTTRVGLDRGSVNRFDKSFYKNLRNGRGVLESDAKLLSNPTTQRFVERFSGVRGTRQLRFNVEFGKSMVKMGNIKLKTGRQGEIRREYMFKEQEQGDMENMYDCDQKVAPRWHKRRLLFLPILHILVLERSKSVKGTLDTVLEGETTESHKNVLSGLDQQKVAQNVVDVAVLLVEQESCGSRCGVDASEEAIILFPEHLSKCTSPPLFNWGLDITTALRLIATTKPHISWDPLSSLGKGDHNDKSSLSLFERVMQGLSVSCQYGPLPVNSFTIISMVSYVIDAIPSYHGSVSPALNELCLGLKPEEVAPALSGVYAKDVHVRMACLNTAKCIPPISTHSVPQEAEVAEDLWDHYDYVLRSDYSGLFKALSHVNYNVRMAAAGALAAVLYEYPDTLQESLTTLFSLYIPDSGICVDCIESGWLGRQGTALALHTAADVLRTKDLQL